MQLKDMHIFMLDLQTTGSTPDRSEILEIAWARPGNCDAQSVLVRPAAGQIPRRIQQLTGISEEDLSHSESLSDALEKLDRFVLGFPSRPTAIIHFAQFETGFLNAAYRQLGRVIPFEILCSHKIAKRLFTNLPTRGIHGLAGYYGHVLEESKRSASHVRATDVIWSGLLADLQKQNVVSQLQFQEWQNATPGKTTKRKYEYPLAKEARLGLPSGPGIYRMLNRNGEVLYVGKATSLRDRVNSYFRGQKNRDAKKLEMLTQVWSLKVTTCDSPLEAALLETDEIKNLNPKYNINLKNQSRPLFFYSRDFSSEQTRQDRQNAIGPFSSALILQPVIRLAKALEIGGAAFELPAFLFFEEIEVTLLREGFLRFCDRHGFAALRFRSVRRILATGLNWYRAELKLGAEASTPDDESPSEDLEDSSGRELCLSADDVADKFERAFLRAARAYQNSKVLTKLLNSTVEWEMGGKTKRLSFCGGAVREEVPPTSESLPWRQLGRATYDRMSVLRSEFARLRLPKSKVVFHSLPHFAHDDEKAPEHKGESNA